MRKLSLTLIAALLAMASAAMAGQENKGAGIGKKYAACVSPNGHTRLEVASQNNGLYRAVVTVDAGLASEQTAAYENIKRLAHPPGLMGAPIQLVGRDFGLTIKIDGRPTRKGSFSSVTAKPLGLQEEALFCKVSR